MHKWYWAAGGGAGDVIYDFLRSRSAWRMAALHNVYGAAIRVITQCHNDGVEDVFKHHPYVTEHVSEPWRLPNADDAKRLHQPLDDYLPLHNDQYFLPQMGGEVELERSSLFLSTAEQRQLSSLLSRRPLIVLQPFAGLSERDAFNAATLRSLVEQLVRREPSCRIAVIGKNHGREQRREEVGFTHPNVVDLIDQLGLRLGYFLVKNCDAFCGSHSNMIRTAWDWRRPNACVLPSPLMTDRLTTLDPKYTYGLQFPETRLFTFPFGHGMTPRYEALDIETVADHLLGR